MLVRDRTHFLCEEIVVVPLPVQMLSSADNSNPYFPSCIIGRSTQMSLPCGLCVEGVCFVRVCVGGMGGLVCLGEGGVNKCVCVCGWVGVCVVVGGISVCVCSVQCC